MGREPAGILWIAELHKNEGLESEAMRKTPDLYFY
jgi:hypothetical protein